jgi:antitoxin VapB
MFETKVAKLFKNGASQAVRLPAEFRFENEEIFVTRHDLTGDVVLSTRPGAVAWGEFFALCRNIEATEPFMADRPMNRVPESRGIFDECVVPASSDTPKRAPKSLRKAR